MVKLKDIIKLIPKHEYVQIDKKGKVLFADRLERIEEELLNKYRKYEVIKIKSDENYFFYIKLKK